ncbi:MAG: DUF2934 domain-containing protein [Proteobacteria bacterium]|nr:DUF2934 domain-containing protein [Pseudomonadota bacterium]
MDYYDEIAKVAYNIFEREGGVHGRHFDHWIEAEIIVTTRYREKNNDGQNATKVSKPKKSTVAKTATKTTAKTAAKSITKKTPK